MNEHLIADLNRFVDQRFVTLIEAPGHVKVNIVRSDVIVSVLIPRSVPEWWVDIGTTSSRETFEDWFDYVGHDDSSDRELSNDMRTDVLSFIESAIARPLRIDVSARVLEWNVSGQWLQAVPFIGHAERHGAAISKNALA